MYGSGQVIGYRHYHHCSYPWRRTTTTTRRRRRRSYYGRCPQGLGY
jgi:hypothetical protein